MEENKQNPKILQEKINELLLEKINPKDYIQRWKKAKTDRLGWESKWQTIIDQIFPNSREFQFGSSLMYSSSVMQPSTDKLKNFTAAVAGKISAVVTQINASITDPTVKWLNLKFGMSALNTLRPTAEWLQGCEEALYNLFATPSSNFYPSTYTFHMDWFTLGTACREIILRKDNGEIRFNCVSMQDIYIELDGYGEVSTIFRKFMLTPRQAYDLWGEAISEEQKKLMRTEEQGGSSQKWEYIEVSTNNPLVGQITIPLPPKLSFVIDTRTEKIIDIGMHQFPPYVVSRFDVCPGETYGRSLPWIAMPNIICENRLARRGIQMIDYATLPPLLVQDATSMVMAQIAPNSFVQGLDPNGRPTIQPLQMGQNLPLLTEYKTMNLQTIDDILLVNEIFPEGAPTTEMSATEVNARKLQYSNRVRPLIVRLEHDDLSHTIIKTVSLLMKTGKIPPFPYDQLGIDPKALPDPLTMLRCTFSGQLAKIQQMNEVFVNEKLLASTIQAAQADQTVLDKINIDEIVSMCAQAYGVSTKVVKSDEEVQQIRQARAQQQAQQNQLAMENQALDNMIKLKNAGINIPIS